MGKNKNYYNIWKINPQLTICSGSLLPRKAAAGGMMAMALMKMLCRKFETVEKQVIGSGTYFRK